MTKKDIFKVIKEANNLVDAMAKVDVDSSEYDNLLEELDWLLESLQIGYHPWYTLHFSKKTGHYCIKFTNE